MKKINFVSSWSDFGPKTWSGTPNGIFTSLSKRISVEFIDVSPRKQKGVIRKIKELIDGFYAHIPTMKYRTRKLNKLCEDTEKTPCLVFSEYNTRNVENLYCYQDLSVDFLIRSGRILAVSPIIGRVVKKNYEKKRKMASRFYEKCAGVFTMSKWLKEDLVNNTGVSPDKVHVVGGGCNADISKIDYSRKAGNKFIFVGVDWKRKNGDLVVKAFEILREKNPEIHLYIAGPSQCPDSVKDKPNIHFLGRVPSDQLHEYYNICDYFVMPSEFEAYGLVFAEALIFGLPCIGKNCFAMPEFIDDGKNGYLIKNTDENELAEKMRELLNNGPKISEKIRADKEYYMQKYSWDAVSERIINVLKNDGYII